VVHKDVFYCLKSCKVCCKVNTVLCVMYYGTAVCSVAQCLHGAHQKMKMGMPVHIMQQIAHSLEKFCDKYYNTII
jgi:hypothetical protein